MHKLKDSKIQWQGDVPTHWTRAKLFRLCSSIGSGGTPTTSDQSLYGGCIPWIQSGDLTDSYVNSTEKTITDEALLKSSAKMFPKGTLLMAMYGATIGKLGIMWMEGAINQACCAMKFGPSFFMKYGYYLFQSLRLYLLTLSYGGGQSNISQQIIRQQYFYFPSLPEQKLIAAYLDASCAAIDRAVETKQKQLATLDTLRKSIITPAILSGLAPNRSFQHIDNSGMELSLTGWWPPPGESSLWPRFPPSTRWCISGWALRLLRRISIPIH